MLKRSHESGAKRWKPANWLRLTIVLGGPPVSTARSWPEARLSATGKDMWSSGSDCERNWITRSSRLATRWPSGHEKATWCQYPSGRRWDTPGAEPALGHSSGCAVAGRMRHCGQYARLSRLHLCLMILSNDNLQAMISGSIVGTLWPYDCRSTEDIESY